MFLNIFHYICVNTSNYTITHQCAGVCVHCVCVVVVRGGGAGGRGGGAGGRGGGVGGVCPRTAF